MIARVLANDCFGCAARRNDEQRSSLGENNDDDTVSSSDDTPYRQTLPRRPNGLSRRRYSARQRLRETARELGRGVLHFFDSDMSGEYSASDSLTDALLEAVRTMLWHYNYGGVFDAARVTFDGVVVDERSARTAIYEALSIAMGVVDRCFALAGWDRVVAVYAYVAHLSFTPFWSELLFRCKPFHYDLTDLGNRAGEYVALRCRGWFKTQKYSFASLENFVWESAATANDFAHDVHVWTIAARRYAFGASVQIYSGGASTADQATALFRLVVLLARTGRDRRSDSAVSPLRLSLAVGDGSAIVYVHRLQHEKFRSDGDDVSCSVRDFILIGDNDKLPDVRFEPYARRFDVAAFRRDAMALLPSILVDAIDTASLLKRDATKDQLPFFPLSTTQRTTDSARMINDLRRVKDERFLAELVETLTTKLSSDEYDIVRPALARALGADQFHDAVHACRCDDECDDDASDNERRRRVESSPFHLLRECVSHIGWASDLSSNEYERALSRLDSVPLIVQRSWRYHIKYDNWSRSSAPYLPMLTSDDRAYMSMHVPHIKYTGLMEKDDYTRLLDGPSLQRSALLAVIKDDVANSRLSRLPPLTRRKLVDDVKVTPTRGCATLKKSVSDNCP